MEELVTLGLKFVLPCGKKVLQQIKTIVNKHWENLPIRKHKFKWKN